MAKKKWAVVVPTNRPKQFSDFLDAWWDLFHEHVALLIVVEDAPKISPALFGRLCEPREIYHSWERRSSTMIPSEMYSWAEIPLEHTARKSDMVRSWGMYRAWESGADYILTLDDDVRPSGDTFAAYEKVFEAGAPLSPYLNVGALTTYGKPLRGFPYRERKPAKVAVQYGGWHGVLDYDAPTQLAGTRDFETFMPVALPVPRGAAVTGCIMNCAWRAEFTPIMWQLPLVNGKYNRFGDIWSGLLQKKTLDHLGHAVVVNGKASVWHQRASDPVTNCVREAPGVPFNEHLWDNLTAAGGTLIDTYRSVTGGAAAHFPDEYAETFLEARDEWLALF